jgi:leader peptidase (prepilin peptidase)/N-methyltransferase
MLIASPVCFYPIPLAWILSYNELLPINLSESILGTAVGYGLLWSIAHLYYVATKQHGLGEGDFDLMALIGAFIGIEGTICTLFLASWVGTIVGIIYLLLYKQSRECRLPFAPFLSCGAMIYVYFQNSIHIWLTGL